MIERPCRHHIYDPIEHTYSTDGVKPPNRREVIISVISDIGLWKTLHSVTNAKTTSLSLNEKNASVALRNAQ